MDNMLRIRAKSRCWRTECGALVQAEGGTGEFSWEVENSRQFGKVLKTYRDTQFWLIETVSYAIEKKVLLFLMFHLSYYYHSMLLENNMTNMS